MQLKELAAQYRATGCALRARAAELRLELAAMPRSGRARRELSERIARLEEMAGETLYTAGYLAHYYDPDSRAPCADCVLVRGVLYWRHETQIETERISAIAIGCAARCPLCSARCCSAR